MYSLRKRLRNIRKISKRRNENVNQQDNNNGDEEDEEEIEIYPKNVIISSKYTVLNFVPKSLFEQFKR